MTRLCVICEGHTEAEFVKTCLEPHFRSKQVYVFPSLLKSRPGKTGGGWVSVKRIARHIKHEYHNSDYITTLVDYYGFINPNCRSKHQLERDILEEAGHLLNNFNNSYVVPYIQMHEFEGLLFSNIEEFRWVVDGWCPEARNKLLEIRNNFTTPEDINNNRETAPSKRVLKIFANGEYSKTEHGPIIASEIGLAKIRQECPLFNEWLTRLENLGQT